MTLPERSQRVKISGQDFGKVPAESAKKAAKLRAERHRWMMAHPELASTDKVVADAMEAFAFYRKTDCEASIPTLAKRVGKGGKAVRLSIQNLVHYGLVNVEIDGSLKTGRRYHLLWLRGEPIAGPDSRAESPRQMESGRIGHARLKALAPPVVGAPLRNYPVVGAPLRNYTPELGELRTLQNEDIGVEERTEDAGLGSRVESPLDPAERSREPGQGYRSLEGERGAVPDAMAEAGREPRELDADVTASIAQLGPDTTREQVENLAGMLLLEFGEIGKSLAYMPAYRRCVKDATIGVLSPESLAYAYGQAKKPGATTPGAVFLAAVARCRKGGGKPTPRKPAARRRSPSKPAPQRRTTDALRNKATVFATVRKGIEGRADDGLSPEVNRTETRKFAAWMCQKHGLEGQDRANYLAWTDEALAVVLDGAPLPTNWESPCRDILPFPPRAAV